MQRKGKLKTLKLQSERLLVSKYFIHYHYPDQTIFSYLDLLTIEQISDSNGYYKSNESVPQEQDDDHNIRKQLNRRAIQQNLIQYYTQNNHDSQTGVLLCDFYSCCCHGCPWQIHKNTKFYAFLSHIRKRVDQFFLKKIKIISFFFIEIASYTYIPISNLSYYSNDSTLVALLSIIFLPFQFFNLLFAISFINTRREIVRLDKQNKIQRALIIYYHLKKCFIFTVLFFISIIILSYILLNEDNQEQEFEELNFYYWLVINIILLTQFKYNQCLKTDLLSEDDAILNAQMRLYTMQNNMIKYLPSDETLIDLNITNQYQLQKHLDNKLQHASQQLHISMDILLEQKFKKIKKNLGTKRAWISLLIIYIFLTTLLQLFLNILIQAKYIKSSDTHKLHWLQVFTNKNQQSIITINDICLFLQYTIFPYLLSIMCNKRAIFGRDYGHELY